MCVNYGVHYGPKVIFACFHITPSHHHHYAELIACIDHKKFLLGNFVECMSKIKYILSITFYAIYDSMSNRIDYFGIENISTVVSGL